MVLNEIKGLLQVSDQPAVASKGVQHFLNMQLVYCTVMSQGMISLLFCLVYPFCHIQKEGLVSVTIQLSENQTDTAPTTQQKNRTNR